MAVQPREIMTFSKTQRDDKSTDELVLIADITVKYTVRDEISNRSGYYITGIQSASVKKVKGWTAIRSDVTIDREHIVYSNNFQTAAVPIVYLMIKQLPLSTKY